MILHPRSARRVAWAVAILTVHASAERVVLKDGTELVGEVQSAEGEVVVRTPVAWYSVSSDQILRTEPDSSRAEPAEVFLLPSEPRKQVRRIEGVASIVSASPFDAFGRRSATITLSNGRDFEIIQSITEIHPTHVRLEGNNADWSTTLSLSEIPEAELLAILDKASAQPTPRIEDGIKLVHFLIQARHYQAAADRLERLRKTMPGDSSRLDELQSQWLKQLEDDALLVTKEMLERGRWESAGRVIAEFTARPGANAQWGSLSEKHQATLAQVDRVRAIAGEVIAEIPALTSLEKSLAEEIQRDVDPRSIERLLPLLALLDQEGATLEKKWGLAGTGWMAGAKLAQPDRSVLQNWLKQREALSAAKAAREEDDFEIALDRVKGTGVTVDLAARLLTLLPAPPAEIAVEQIVSIPAARSEDVPYSILLPAGYQQASPHLLIVALHGLKMTPEDAVAYWREVAEGLNAVVVAPEYLLAPDRAYTYSLAEHERMEGFLHSVRNRWNVDPARTFLVGHDAAGMAAFDFGWSHPDEWAGVVVLGGAPQFYMQYYHRNVSLLPTYTVHGQLAGANLVATRSLFKQNFKRGDPVLTAVLAGRGAGSYSHERKRIGDWMARQRRPAYPSTVIATSARHSDRRFYWMQIDQFLPKSTIAPELYDQKKGLRPAKLEGVAERGQILRIETSGTKGLELRLAPELVSLSDPNLEIYLNRKLIHSGPIQADLATLLQEARRTGDRDRLVHCILPIR